ncbi:Bcrio2 [Botrytis cinerea B05.10]|uniref:Serine/threonine-protein kinase RIO2 n=2 Tax=Botryotinia fuckeliana TaxID=40559 RepID=A0A384JYU8_BOTFB|nr:Bcrio2 [Botrytis cinerea B05.10]ATZ55750.1 Bcrio2 [Botrytis cinerea B05.10]EMR87811.1 putative serine threonine-protein kinase rio2 protein [Botrytis cinerea BcDW1]
MKLDTKAMRYLTAEDWRTLTAVEQGSKNHEVVPTKLIEQLSGLRGGVHRCISALAKVNLIARLKNAKYDGYRLTYGGLDYLALNTYRKRKDVYSVGNQIGVGKESDIFVVADEKGVQRVLKIHRLGRISFRTVKANRDYLRHRSSASWMHMSRLAALKEFTFMTALRDNGFPVPEPLAQSRHTIVMSLIDAFPMRQISSVPDPASLYAELISMILRLAQYGLIHGDFNEFNILIKEETNPENPEEVLSLTPILIDFPQMVSVDHVNAEYYFDRDVNCIKRFFDRRFHFTSNEKGPHFKDARKLIGKDGVKRLDVSVEASGFSKKMAKELEAYMKAVGVDGDGEPGAERSDDDFDDDEDDDDDEEEDEEEEEEEKEAADPANVEQQNEETTETKPKGDAEPSNDDKEELSLSNLKIEEKT